MNLPTYPVINSSFYIIILLHYSVTGLKIYIHFANKFLNFHKSSIPTCCTTPLYYQLWKTYDIKFEYAQQAQVVYTFKHIQVNLKKTNAAIWINKESKKPSTNTKIHKD